MAPKADGRRRARRIAALGGLPGAGFRAVSTTMLCALFAACGAAPAQRVASGAQRPAQPPTAARERVSDVAAPGIRGGDGAGRPVRLGFLALGSVETDGFSLPLLSPDGRFLAVQSGEPPDLATALARPGQRPPRASRITLYRLDERGILRLGETEPGLVLGRAADNAGFLIESPRPDGARWIGRIRWGAPRESNDYAPEWLVQDGRVNAFATLGPGGALAYSARDVRTANFDLVVRARGRTLRLDGAGLRSYIYPALDPDGARVLAFAVRDGIAELMETTMGDLALGTEAPRHRELSDRADDAVVAQMATPQGHLESFDRGAFLFFLPEIGSVVRLEAEGRLVPMRPGCLAWARLDETHGVSLADGQVRLDTPGAGASGWSDDVVVLPQVAVPRALPARNGAGSVLLFAPDRARARLTRVSQETVPRPSSDGRP